MEFTPLIPLFHFFKTKNQFSFRVDKDCTVKDEDKKFTSYNSVYLVQKI